MLFIGEAPGAAEDKAGIPFLGKTGQEVNQHYLPLAGLRREDVTFTNAIACLPASAGGKLDPKRKADLALLDACTNHHLYPLIETMQPELLVAMGAFACRALDPNINLDLQHGIPVETSRGPVFPMYHPALGLYEPKRMLLLRNDWVRLKQYRRGILALRQDAYPHPDYVEVTSPAQIVIDPQSPLAADTEYTQTGDPHCLTYSTRPGSGRLIRASRPDLLARFHAAMQRHRAPVLFHNWLADHPVTRAMGIVIPDRLIVDTMALAYHLGNLPQGLKALAHRELGMAMQDFNDLVRPYSRQLALDYFRAGYESGYPWAVPEPELVRDEKGAWKVYTAQGIGRKLKQLFTALKKDPDKDVFQAWENWAPHHAELEAVLGPFPGIDIRHAPHEEMLQYAVRDADATLRLYVDVLAPMRRNVRRKPQDRWRPAA